MLTGGSRLNNEIAMEGRRSRHHDRVDVGILKDTGGVGLGTSTETVGEGSRRVDTRIDDDRKTGGVNISGDGGGMVGTDPAGTDEGDADGWGEWHDDSFVMRAAGGFCVAF